MIRPQAPKGDVCPLHRCDVSKVCHKCPMYQQFRGVHPQTGAELDQWLCSLASLPMLLLENSQQTRQAGAAIESFRNEMVRDNETFTKTLVHSARAAMALSNGRSAEGN